MMYERMARRIIRKLARDNMLEGRGITGINATLHEQHNETDLWVYSCKAGLFVKAYPKQRAVMISAGTNTVVLDFKWDGNGRAVDWLASVLEIVFDFSRAITRLRGQFLANVEQMRAMTDDALAAAGSVKPSRGEAQIAADENWNIYLS